MAGRRYEEEQMNYYIPLNVLQTGRIMGFRRRNIIEGIISVLICSFLITRIPFVPRVKWIIVACVGIFVMGFNLIGIKGMSISEVIFSAVRHLKEKGKYHLRSIDNAKIITRDKKTGRTRAIREQSAAEKIYGFIKEKIHEIRNREET